MYDDRPERGRSDDPWSDPLPPDEPTFDIGPAVDEDTMRRMERRAARERSRRRPSADSSDADRRLRESGRRSRGSGRRSRESGRRPIDGEQRPREKERRSRIMALVVFVAVAAVLVVAMVAWAGGDEDGAQTIETVPVRLVPLTPEFLQENGSGDAGDWSTPALPVAALRWPSV